jgi:hypothetical protein
MLFLRGKKAKKPGLDQVRLEGLTPSAGSGQAFVFAQYRLWATLIVVGIALGDQGHPPAISNATLVTFDRRLNTLGAAKVQYLM